MPKKILIIDDEPAVRKAFTYALDESGYQLDTADCGETGVEMFNNDDYSLVFLDMKMPGMNGAQTLRKLREHNLATPVYIVTAFHKEFLEELQVIHRDGIKFELLRKPLGNDEIVTIVDSVLNKPRNYNN